jgi:hypothetical protein
LLLCGHVISTELFLLLTLTLLLLLVLWHRRDRATIVQALLVVLLSWSIRGWANWRSRRKHWLRTVVEDWLCPRRLCRWIKRRNNRWQSWWM